MILGIDEVGRGAWAGPLAVAAVALGGVTVDGLTDSKLLTKKKRILLARQIKQTAPSVGIGWVSARDLDAIGLSEALRLATRRAVTQIDLRDIDQIIIDGTINYLSDTPLQQGSSLLQWGLGGRVVTMKKADITVPSVSAASVIAKVARDDYMALCDIVFPGYGFCGHVGYGAAKHRAALEKLGVLPIHRTSFAPILNMVGKDNENQHSRDNAAAMMNTPTRVGQIAETAAVEYLVSQGYRIIERNWKTKWCEIDIIVERDMTMSFVEVKYRRRADQGGGIAAITPKKLRQMRFAAELWLTRHPERNATLRVIEVAGDNYDITHDIVSVE